MSKTRHLVTVLSGPKRVVVSKKSRMPPQAEVLKLLNIQTGVIRKSRGGLSVKVYPTFPLFPKGINRRSVRAIRRKVLGV